MVNIVSIAVRFIRYDDVRSFLIPFHGILTTTPYIGMYLMDFWNYIQIIIASWGESESLNTAFETGVPMLYS
jgi:hypothetical protein